MTEPSPQAGDNHAHNGSDPRPGAEGASNLPSTIEAQDEAARSETSTTNPLPEVTTERDAHDDDQDNDADEEGEGDGDEDEEDGDNEEEDEEEEEEEDEEPRLKYARLTQHLGPVYRNGDATSAFLVAGDKMVCPTPL